MQHKNIIALLFLSIWLAACGALAAPRPAPTPEITPLASTLALPGLPAAQIVRQPDPENTTYFNAHPSKPTYDPNSTDPFQDDLRSANLTRLDLSKSKEALLYANFDSKTQWPTAAKMPADFDWQKEPYDDAAVIEQQTPRGQDVKALILLSPEDHAPC